MLLFVPSETLGRETRVALDPESTKRLIDLGLQVTIERGAGEKSYYLDADYEAAGARIVTERAAALKDADGVLRVNAPSREEIAL